MKFGYRKPSIKKSIKARTTGKIKRQAKKAINPMYGQKGVGFIKNPQKSIKDSIYHKTTYDITAPLKEQSTNERTSKIYTNDNKFSNENDIQLYEIIDADTVKIGNKKYSKKQTKKFCIIFLIFAVVYLLIGLYIFPFLILGLFFFFISYTWNKIHKELNNKK